MYLTPFFTECYTSKHPDQVFLVCILYRAYLSQIVFRIITICFIEVKTSLAGFGYELASP